MEEDGVLDGAVTLDSTQSSDSASLVSTHVTLQG